MKVANVHLTFEEALKLHLGLGQLLGKLNGYHRGTKGGRQAAAIVRVYFDGHRITVNEGTLRPKSTKAAGAPVAGSDKSDVEAMG